MFGAGGVGLAAIQGARIAGARHDHRRRRVREQAGDGERARRHAHRRRVVDDPVAAIRELTGGGVDYAFEAIGLAEGRASRRSTACSAGGTATIIGMIPVGQKVELDARLLLRENKIQGSSMGSNRFRVDMPRYIDFYRRAG